ncbi:MAG: type II toxin-antitoxin system RatA family toxin [Proteobacteria bacterium]|nr:type II toxin-antitoxin system RatA family toxin [Pseudomonadota bacterium]MDA0993571.1 type II toxin-antitoxin system RatA family toxin [Pseudomonadota bacterium]
MRRVNRSALVPYRASEMFRLVDDVDSYAEFLPWCSFSKVLSRRADSVDATLELHKGTIAKKFTTRNTLKQNESIDIELIGGLFRHLAGGWRFQSFGAEGSKVSLELEFEFASRMVDVMFGPFFEETCNSMIEAFTRRAAAVYGDR